MGSARNIVVGLLLVVGSIIGLSYVRANLIIDDVYYWPGIETMAVEAVDTVAPVDSYPEPEYRHVSDDTIPGIRFTLIQDTVVKAVIHRP